MYCVIPVEPDDERADLAVLFMHNEGYSTMCGHAVIALGRWAIDCGIVEPAGENTIVRIQCPCGLVTARVAMGTSADGEARTGDVSFESVPAFAHTLDAVLEVPGYGKVTLDIGYGGAFYAILPAASLGLDVRASPIRDLVDAGDAVTKEVTRKLPVEHPDDPDLGFVYGTILTDGGEGSSHQEPSANVCIFADRQVDRSPTGSGAAARVALMAARGTIGPGQPVYFESVTRAVFVARELARGKLGERQTVSVEVTGRAHYTGTARFTAEPDDMLAGGFLLP
jgi:trans-L-3-hydroxyproline dehydratase